MREEDENSSPQKNAQIEIGIAKRSASPKSAHADLQKRAQNDFWKKSAWADLDLDIYDARSQSVGKLNGSASNGTYDII
jgi:hypothetical protein